MQSVNLLKGIGLLTLLLIPSNEKGLTSIFQTINHNDLSFTVASIPLEKYNLDLVGEPNARRVVRNHKPILLMNAGMFHPNHDPVGLEIIDGETLNPLNIEDGEGNFFLKPNGVFAIHNNTAVILDSPSFDSSRTWSIATQSGPLLLYNGEYHPKLKANSSNLHIRNGVCPSENTVHLIISEEPVRFYDLASLMKEKLNCDDGLYLDGSVSKLYHFDGSDWTPELSRKPLGNWLIVRPKL